MATSKQEKGNDRLDIEDSDHSKSVLEKFNGMREAGKECDLIIKAEGKEIPVHRNFMMVVSDYFDAMFSHDTEEKKSGIVEMEEIGYPILLKCVIYLYTGKLSICKKECEPMLLAATLMQLTSVCEKIVEFLEDHLEVSSFFDTKRIASKFDLESMHEACDNFALEHFEVLSTEKEFSTFEVEYVTLLLTSEKIHPSVTEDMKLASIVQWIKGNPEKRQHNLLGLMKLLDLKKVSVEYGRFLVKNEKMFLASGECMGLLFLEITERSTTKINPDANSLLIFNTKSKCIEAYRPSDQSFSQIHPFFREMDGSCFTAVVCGDFLFVLMAMREVYKINYRNKSSSWVQLTNMSEDHDEYLRGTVYDQHIYVAGNKSMERYSIESDEWNSIKADGITLYGSTIVDYHGEVYVLGGYVNGRLHDVNKLSPTTLTWTPVKPMLLGRDLSAAAVHLERIFVVGGDWESNNKVPEFYDQRSDSWTRISPMILGRCGFGLCVANHRLFAVGSSSRYDPLTVEVYDYKKNEWTDVLKVGKKEVMSRATVSVYFPE